jgi:hypothetical protein
MDHHSQAAEDLIHANPEQALFSAIINKEVVAFIQAGPIAEIIKERQGRFVDDEYGPWKGLTVSMHQPKADVPAGYAEHYASMAEQLGDDDFSLPTNEGVTIQINHRIQRQIDNAAKRLHGIDVEAEADVYVSTPFGDDPTPDGIASILAIDVIPGTVYPSPDGRSGDVGYFGSYDEEHEGPDHMPLSSLISLEVRLLANGTLLVSCSKFPHDKAQRSMSSITNNLTELSSLLQDSQELSVDADGTDRQQ